MWYIKDNNRNYQNKLLGKLTKVWDTRAIYWTSAKNKLVSYSRYTNISQSIIEEISSFINEKL